MKFSVDVLETQSEISTAILTAMIDPITKQIKNGAKELKRKIPLIIETAIKSQPEYNSLISGQLKDEFGLAGAAQKIDSLINIWQKIEIDIQQPRIKGKQITGGITINAIRSDYSDVLNLPAALQTTKKGQNLPWLDWLLIQGDKVIIKEYDLVVGKGRAGNTIMRRNVAGKWSVPSSFAGTPNNNWIT